MPKHLIVPNGAGSVNGGCRTVVRTREKTNPLYVSPGHLIDVEHATQFVLNCSAGYRLPEPTRWAHKVAGGEKLANQDNDQLTLF